MKKKFICLLALTLVFSTFVHSAPKSSSRPSSRPSSSRSSSSYSKPSSRPSIKPSTPSSRPSIKPSTPSSRPSIKPSTPSSQTPTSTKPLQKSTYDPAAVAQKKEESKINFQSSKPVIEKPVTYTSNSGKTYTVDKTSSSVKNIQSTVSPQEYSQRNVRVEHHYHNYYGDRYGYYRRQPYIDVGGGYSALFWYAMMDWSAERRALWLYNNQNNINANLYNEQLKNEALRIEIEKLKAKNASIDPNYVDPEFRENPDLMYSDEYVDAIIQPTSNISVFWLLVGILIVGCLIVGIYLIFFKNWEVEGY